MDSFDYKIVTRLMEQGRATWAELGGILGLTAPAAAERVRKLEESKIIKGYAALIDPEQVGLGLAALISVTLERPEHRSVFLEAVRKMNEILECYHIAGEEDYVLKIRCAGTHRLESLISDDIKGIPGVIRTRSTIILSTVKETPILPLNSLKES
jgi:Lrp/AsnC family leucine-responsive transcriptional regulator